VTGGGAVEVTNLGLRELQNVLNAASLVSIISTDPEGLITVFNPGSERMLGYQADEMIGKQTPALIHLESEAVARGKELSEELGRPIEGFDVFVVKALENGYEEREWTYVQKDGGHIQVNLGVTAIRDDRGEIVGFLGIGTDITERKNTENKLAESEARHHFFLDNVEEGVLLAEEGKIIDASDVWLAMFGYTREEAIGASPLEVVSLSDRDRVAGLIKESYSDPYEAQLLRKDGTTFPAHLRGRIVQFGGRSVRLATVLDITRHKEAEAALIAAKAEAEKANRAKSEFLSSMSHELRTPMNAILGFSQMLELNPDEPLTATQKTCVKEISNGGQLLLSLINEVLDLTKIEAGKMDLLIENVCTRVVLDECLSLVKSMAENRGIEISVGDSFQTAPSIRADHTRLKQSLLNLMSNAVKYNRENGNITLGCYQTPSGRLRITVADTGHGVPEDKLSELFQPFSRLKAEKSEIEGTGIGLSITKQLVEMMDGEIGVDTVVGTGTTFWIELPLSTQDDVVVQETRSQADGLDDAAPLTNISGTVLYIEDNPANLQLMKMIFKRVAPLTLVSAHTAELGIGLASSSKPDLIILDINLPGMNGYEALDLLKESVETKDIPVVALSASAMPGDIEKGVKAGFKRYLTKPIKVKEVVTAISAVLGDTGHH